MTRRVPGDEEVVVSLKNVLRSMGVINSQRKLRELVLRDLRERDPESALGEVRLRRLALGQDFVTVEIKYRETGDKKALSRCPVCGGKIKTIHNKTVFNGKVILGFECKSCPYGTGIKRRVPTRYIFSGK